MTLIFNRLLEDVKVCVYKAVEVHVRAKFYQAECSGLSCPQTFCIISQWLEIRKSGPVTFDQWPWNLTNF